MKILLIVVSLLLIVSGLFASDFEDNLKQLLEDNGKEYVKPLLTAFGTNLNTGLYNTADVLTPSLLRPVRFGFNLHVMMAMVPSSDKTFEAEIDGMTYETATVFGKDGGHDALPGGFDVSMVPLFVPQFRFGLPAGNELMVRYLPPIDLQDYGKGDFWGVAVKHSIDQHIPLFPIDLAVQGAYQSLAVGDMIDLTSMAFNIHASKSILMWTLYGGLGYEDVELEAKYEYEPSIEGLDPQEVNFDMKSDNNYRMTLGFRYTVLPFIHLNGDYTISEYHTFCLGLGVTF